METALTELIPVLLDKTVKKRLTWEAFTAGSSFIARVGGMLLEIGTSRDGTRLSLRDEEGRLLEAVNYNDVPPPVDQWLNDLFDLARRQALKVDEAIDNLRGALNNL